MTSERADTDILWAALGEEGTETQRRAVAAAFAFIAAADGTASAAELITFQGRINTSAVFADVDHQAFWKDYGALADGLLRGDAEVRAEIETRLAAVIDDDAGKDIVVAAARLAIIADGELNEREEVAMAHIARLIGRPGEALLGE
jgi:tellurite resistance protein